MLFEFIDGSVAADEASHAQLSISPPPAVHGLGGAHGDGEDGDYEDDEDDDSSSGSYRDRSRSAADSGGDPTTAAASSSYPFDTQSASASPGAPGSFVSCPSSLTLSYDWDELLVYKKVMAVICLCHCPSATKQPEAQGTLDEAYEQFQGVRASLLHPGGPFVYK